MENKQQEIGNLKCQIFDIMREQEKLSLKNQEYEKAKIELLQKLFALEKE